MKTIVDMGSLEENKSDSERLLATDQDNTSAWLF